jgi:hypothetical protein
MPSSVPRIVPSASSSLTILFIFLNNIKPPFYHLSFYPYLSFVKYEEKRRIFLGFFSSYLTNIYYKLCFERHFHKAYVSIESIDIYHAKATNGER